MATTSLWHIQGSLKDLIDYVENPEKTVLDRGMNDFLQVFAYVKNPEKTERGQYVSAINCLKETALKQMILTKKQYAKTDKYIAWHGYQSFKPGEISAEQCHEIGVRLAQEMWGDKYQIIVSTHLDREHLHNHFCFNSVSFLDGKKYNYSKAEQKRLRDTSDELCREYGLSVIDRPKKAPSRPLYLDEKSKKPTRYNIYREDIWEALEHSFTLPHFAEYLIRKGYQVDLSGKHWKIKLPKYKHFTRMDTLGESFTPDGICDYIADHYNFYRPPVVEFSPFCPENLQNAWKPKIKTTRIYRLYLFYCYQLGILPKDTEYKPTSLYLKEDLRKLDEISAHVNYMSKYKIETIDDLHADFEEKQTKIDALIEERKHLQNRIRRALPKEREQLRTEKAEVTAKIIQLRKQLKCNQSIEKRAHDIEERLNAAHENQQKANEKEKQKWKYSRDVK